MADDGAPIATESKAPRNEYSPQRVLVTGGAGFIGSHVATRLATRYPQMRVVVLDKLDYCASPRNLDAVVGRPNFKFIKGDVQSSDLGAWQFTRTERKILSLSAGKMREHHIMRTRGVRGRGRVDADAREPSHSVPRPRD